APASLLTVRLCTCAGVASVISAYPSPRPFCSAGRRTIPRRKLGARSIRFKAPSVQRISVTTASSESGALMVVLVSLLVKQFLELLPRLEERDLLGRDRNGGARFWIASFLHPPRPEAETPEPSDFRLVPVLQRISDAIKDRVDDDLCLPFRQRRDLLRDSLNDLRFRHVRFPFRCGGRSAVD